jgi:hypothetical protein
VALHAHSAQRSLYLRHAWYIGSLWCDTTINSLVATVRLTMNIVLPTTP